MSSTAANSRTMDMDTGYDERLRARIDELANLPTSVAVAMRFIELGRDANAGPAEYAAVLSADASLSAKLLALSNSSFYGVRNKITSIKGAVNMLGLGTVRTLAISYCMSGVHNQLDMSPAEAQMFWEPSLCKAVAAKQYMRRIEPQREDEGFLCGMLQDLALTVMYATARDEMVASLKNEQLDWRSQLEAQRAVFGRDHAQAGRLLAQKLDLPDLLVDVIAFHHESKMLQDHLDNPALADACRVASLFPHLLNTWNSADADELCILLGEQSAKLELDPSGFLADVQSEFEKLYRFFEDGAEPEVRLGQMLQLAAHEAAGQTERLVQTVQQLLNQATTNGQQMSRLLERQTGLEKQTQQDPLTGVCNREGLRVQSDALLAKAVRYGVGLAVVYLDLDRFKQVNDSMGHDVGDVTLQRIATHMRDALGQHDIAARLGGDEFVLLLYDCTEASANVVISQLLHNVANDVIGRGNRVVTITLSAGCLWVRPTGKALTLNTLISAADQLMYAAKRGGGNRMASRSVSV